MKHLSIVSDPLTILLDGNDTGNAYTLMEAVLAPGGGTPPHVHEREDETFQVMAGEVTFYVGGKTILLKQGEFLFAPRGTPHHFTNTGNSEAILIETATPSGIGHFFAEVGTPISGRNAERIPSTPESIAKLIATAPKYGIQILISKDDKPHGNKDPG